MNQEYFNKLADQLIDSVASKQLGNNLETICLQYADILRDNVLDMNQKYQVSILVEELLGRIRNRDFPIKVEKKSKYK